MYSFLDINKIINNEVIIVVKDSFIAQKSDNIQKTAHCIDTVRLELKKRKISYKLIKRSQLTGYFNEQLVISIGGDGTLLDASHHCQNSLLLGINSDEQHSIGALCTAFVTDFFLMLDNLYKKQADILEISRLRVFINDQLIDVPVLNEVLFCHSNPASISKYSLKINDLEETHRSSGIFVCTSIGCSGAVFSAGGLILPITQKKAQYLVREFYWSDKPIPKLLHGFIEDKEKIVIKNEIENAKIYIDGAHKSFIVPKNALVKIEISPSPLWLFRSEKLINRNRLIEQRGQHVKSIRSST